MRGWYIYDEKCGKYYDGKGGFHHSFARAKLYVRMLSALKEMGELKLKHPEMRLVVE